MVGEEGAKMEDMIVFELQVNLDISNLTVSLCVIGALGQFI